LEIFKEELTFDDIMNKVPYKMLIELRDARASRMERDKEKAEKDAANMKSNNIQNSILRM
jgi:hypothetical protein